ncbi:MAG: transketolase-like TK C-terminal-containing protein, partial [Methylocystis sp.]
FRPADAIETAECWEIAINTKQTPSALSLSRQNLATLNRPIDENLSSKGAYILREPDGRRDITLLATGSEVEIALEAAEKLALLGKYAAVVSMPCWELFEAQTENYRKKILGSAPRIGIEAAVRLGWDRWIGENGTFIGMHGFGASAPANQLYQHFRITADSIVTEALALIK